MIIYLVQKYLTHSIVFLVGLTIFPLSLNDDMEYVIVRGFFFGGLFGGIYTYYDFRKRHLWPLYDNLRYSKYFILSFCFIGFQALFYIIKPFI